MDGSWMDAHSPTSRSNFWETWRLSHRRLSLLRLQMKKFRRNYRASRSMSSQENISPQQRSPLLMRVFANPSSIETQLKSMKKLTRDVSSWKTQRLNTQSSLSESMLTTKKRRSGLPSAMLLKLLSEEIDKYNATPALNTLNKSLIYI